MHSQVIMMTIYPVLIAPLFNKYDPLPEVSTIGATIVGEWEGGCSRRPQTAT